MGFYSDIYSRVIEISFEDFLDDSDIDRFSLVDMS